MWDERGEGVDAARTIIGNDMNIRRRVYKSFVSLALQNMSDMTRHVARRLTHPLPSRRGGRRCPVFGKRARSEELLAAIFL